MIKFFRKLRYNLISENKTSKYLKYAIGEIALIIIGILLALQISEWNQNGKNKREERKLLSALQNEFLQNKEDIIEIKAHYVEIVKANNQLMKLIGNSESNLTTINIDSLMSVSINIDNYIPSNYVLNNMISTAKLDLITSEKLRVLLYNWTQEIGQKEDAYNMLYKYFMESLIPYLSKNTSIKSIDYYTPNGFISEPSKLQYNPIKMFNSLEFENHVDNYFYTVTTFIESLTKLENVINQILIEAND